MNQSHDSDASSAPAVRSNNSIKEERPDTTEALIEVSNSSWLGNQGRRAAIVSLCISALMAALGGINRFIFGSWDEVLIAVTICIALPIAALALIVAIIAFFKDRATNRKAPIGISIAAVVFAIAVIAGLVISAIDSHGISAV